MTGTRVGWIGTGVMGAPMCGHLLASGYPVTVFNRTPERARGLLERGAAWAESPQAVAQHADVVFTMVGFPDDVREIVLGPAGTLAGAGHGTILVDMTTSEPSLAREIYEAARARGVASLDAPVSGGDVGARAAGLSIMVGGDRDAFERVAPLLRCLGSRGSRPWSGRLHLQHLRRRVERADRRRHARVARGLHQHLDQLLARDAEVEGAREVQLQLLGPSERRELRHGAQAPAAQIEVRARPEHAEHELRHQAEELRRKLLRRQLPAAGARAPELPLDPEAAREVVRLSRHRFSPL